MTGEVNSATRHRALPPLLSAMRPYQWPKNALVFAAFAFSAGDAWKPGDLHSWWPLLWRTLLLFALWCLVSSATYLINDVQDREFDRLHPRKKFRPIASGTLSVRRARFAAIVLLAVAIPPVYLLDLAAGGIITGYAAVMAAYSYGFKRVAILDVLILCSGVIGRAISGATVIDVSISPWLYVCTSFGAFFFASSKRWSEYRQLGPGAARHRPALAMYTHDILEQMLIVSAAAALLSYALYTIESAHVPANGAMAVTLPFVAFGLFRYLLLLDGPRKADAPDQILFTDPQILIAVAGFLATAMTIMAMHQS